MYCPDMAVSKRTSIRVLTKEWRKRVRSKLGFEPGSVFVMMSLVRPDSRVAFNAMKRAGAAIGLKVDRVDDSICGIEILPAIKERIENCQFIICDVTGERQNVYYELGYAHGLGHEPSQVLLVAKQGTNVHFNLSGYKIAYYLSSRQLERIVKRGLAAMLITDAEDAAPAANGYRRSPGSGEGSPLTLSR